MYEYQCGWPVVLSVLLSAVRSPSGKSEISSYTEWISTRLKRVNKIVSGKSNQYRVDMYEHQCGWHDALSVLSDALSVVVRSLIAIEHKSVAVLSINMNMLSSQMNKVTWQVSLDTL